MENNINFCVSKQVCYDNLLWQYDMINLIMFI
jgi:hypothetical protein